MHLRFFKILIIGILLLPGQLFAAAWTLHSAANQIIDNFTYYETGKFFDSSGHRKNQPIYRKLEYNPYIEHGVSDSLTVGASPRFQYTRQEQPGNPGNSYAFYGSDFFLRRKFIDNNGHVFSIQPRITVPGIYNEHERPPPGEKTYAAELRALYGYGFKYKGQEHFAGLELGYNKRFGAPEDQVNIDGTLGIRFCDDLMLLNQFFMTFKTGDSKERFFISDSNDYNLVKLQASLVKTLRPDLSLQGGINYNAMGDNTGAGGGIIIALWYQF